MPVNLPLRALAASLPFLLSFLWAALVLPDPASAQGAPAASARLFLTAKGTSDRLAPKGSVPFASLPQPQESAATIIVDPDKAFQTIVGIGGAITDASAETLARLPAAVQEEVISAYFHPEKGIGYSLIRTHIHSCDFSSSSYTYVEPNDTALKSFSVKPDLRYRVPLIRRALAMAGDAKVFASPWSPPAWMKDNHDMLKGGKLKAECFDAWARYFVRFVEEYEKLGIPMWGLTVQNEPMAVQTWESCIFTGEDERDFVKNHLGPVLARAGLDRLRLMIWDHNRGLLYQRAKAVLDDPEAAKYVWGTAFHWYVGDHFDNVRMVHDAWPDKQVLFSEGCVYPFSWKTIDDWNWGETYGRSMINDFNHWAAGWTDWNILVDERGGPNHVANYCFAPLVGDTRTGKVHYMNSFYYIGHFSRFVRPGAKRVACTSTVDDLLACAFLNPDGHRVAVVMNPTDKAQECHLWSDGRAARTQLPAHSIATFTW